MFHAIKPAKGSTHRRKRVARGNSAGGGTTGGRGGKGQQGRSGYSRRFSFEGGQTPLVRRQPKLGGFQNPHKITYEPLTLAILEKKLEGGSYDLAALRTARIVRTKQPVKLLATGTVTKKFNLTVNAASKSAIELIKKAGGTVTIIK